MGHVKDLRTLCLRSLQLLPCLSHMSWRAYRTTLLRDYRCITRSQVDYGCQIYGSASASVLKTLDHIHHQALHLSTGAFHTSLISLYAKTGEPSFAHWHDKLCLQMYTRILGMPRIPAWWCLTSADSDHYFQNHSYHTTQNLCSATGSWWEPTLCAPYARVFHSSLLNGAPPSLCGIMFSTQELACPLECSTSLLFYTDGSKCATDVDFATMFPHKVISGRLPSASYVFTA